MIDLPSPNHGPRPAGTPVDILLIHYTGMRTAADALDRLRDPAAQVSAHYTIDEDGTIYRMVPEQRRAWHAGVSCWRGDRDVNGRSIGIELVNPGHDWGYRPFPEAQMASLERLARAVMRRHGIMPSGVLGHSDVAPMRKRDPGELFDWSRLARAGVGLWPEPTARDADPREDGGIERLLARIGYDLTSDADPAAAAHAAIAAFQRRFRASKVDGIADAQTLALARALLRRLDPKTRRGLRRPENRLI